MGDFLTNPENIALMFDVLQVAALAIVAWVIPTYVRPLVGSKVTSELIEVLNEAIESGFYLAEHQGLRPGSREFLRHVEAYARQSIPDTIARISPLPDVLDRKIAAEILKIASRQLERTLESRAGPGGAGLPGA